MPAVTPLMIDAEASRNSVHSSARVSLGSTEATPGLRSIAPARRFGSPLLGKAIGLILRRDPSGDSMRRPLGPPGGRDRQASSSGRLPRRTHGSPEQNAAGPVDTRSPAKTRIWQPPGLPLSAQSSALTRAG